MDDSKARTAGIGRALAWLASVAALAAAIVAAYWPSFVVLYDRWTRDDNYSHGLLIAPIAAYILWRRRGSLRAADVRPTWWGFLPLLGLLALRYPLFERNDLTIEQATIPLVVGAAVLAVGGWGLLRWALPAVLYLFFMIPLPPSINEYTAGPLQSLATWGSVSLLQAIGRPALAEGNVILIGGQHLEVAEACRGLSMLLSFAALITAWVVLDRDRSLLERLLLMASIVPIALLCNILRIATTSLVYEQFNRKVETAHDYAGYAMMVMALLFVMLELKVMSWLFVDVGPAGGGASAPGGGGGGGAAGLIRPSYGAPRPEAR